MTTRKKLNANKKLQKTNTQEVEHKETLEKDDLLLLDDDGDDFKLDLDNDEFVPVQSDDDLPFDEDESKDDDLDFDEDESEDDDLPFDEDESEDDDLDFDEDESEDDNLDFDEDESEDDDLDFDEDESEDESTDDNLDSDDESEDDDLFSDTAELDNDPFAFVVELRQAALPASTKMLMAVKEVDYKIVPAEESKYGNEYKKFTLVGEVKHPTTKELITIKETGTTRKASFVQKVTAINNGTQPKSLSELVGKKAIVTIVHNTDQLGNVWDNLDTVESYNPSSKRKSK